MSLPVKKSAVLRKCRLSREAIGLSIGEAETHHRGAYDPARISGGVETG